MIRRPCTRAFLMVQGMKAFLFTCSARPHDLSHPSMSAPEMWTRDMMATRTPWRGKQVVKDWVDISGLHRSLLREGSLGTRDPCKHAGPQVGQVRGRRQVKGRRQVRGRSSCGRGETHSQSGTHALGIQRLRYVRSWDKYWQTRQVAWVQICLRKQTDLSHLGKLSLSQYFCLQRHTNARKHEY